MQRAEKHYQRAVEHVALQSQFGVSEAKIAQDMGQTRSFVRYWSAKAADPTVHTDTVGGARHCLFPAEEQLLIEVMLWAEVARNPLQTRREFAAILTARGFPIDAKYG
jgi:hypothetical protein